MIVLDTDVLVAGVRSATGASRVLLEAVERGLVTALASVPLMFECEAVLKREGQLTAAGMTEKEADAVLDMLAARLVIVRVSYLWRPQLRDPADEMVLETAINGRASMIVSFNLPDYAQAPSRFGIEALRPGEALRRLAWPGRATLP